MFGLILVATRKNLEVDANPNHRDVSAQRLHKWD